jgi:hypothetical protein
MNKTSRFFIAVVSLGLISSAVQAAPSLTVGKASGAAGTSVNVPIRLDPGSTPITGAQFDLVLPAGWSAGKIVASSETTAANKTVTTRQVGQAWRVIIFGMNQNNLPSGTLLTVEVQIPKAPQGKSAKLTLTGVALTDNKGNAIKAKSAQAGTITITP